ncbi:DapH/DapD/GlmU-related protein [Thermosyntropha sp.]|uniref:gamma carbonic anhydrase family protein n=1 Tax=Thermosyntropha sp. TaxID=2740820 RepID=UPI0025DCE1A0|nr:DapH/DapD/GlmU-related protein [Thermosyntropha sp.]MBO8159459.1 phenylacetic acid degradation protein PaaY [Thermosyntropha sp.]
MPLYDFEGKKPVIGKDSFVHPQAVLIGEVVIGKNCYIGAGAVLRGDYGKIIVENGSNIQDNATLHAEPGTEAVVSENALIGHAAIVHGPCNIGQNSVIGMGSVVNTGCQIGPESLLAAGSVLPPNKTVPSRKIAMGNPARIVKDLDENMLNYNKAAVKIYQDLAERYLKGLKLIKE